MQRGEALDQLPTRYAVALRLAESGAEPELIARALGIEPESVQPLLLLAHAKLAELLAADDLA